MIKLLHGDCLELMKQIPDKSVDMILQDPPYNTTACKWEWDIMTKIDEFWAEWKRIIKPNGAIVMTASQPFTTKLIASNYKDFKYCWVWEKNKASNIFQAKYAPMKKHEDVCVFYMATPTFNPIKVPRSESGKNRAKTVHNPSNTGKREFVNGFVQTKVIKYEEDLKNPESIVYFNNARGLHPTQKPAPLMEYLIKTYTNEGETVFDGFVGSGTTGVACKNLNRRFIGIELDETYFKIAEERIKAA